MIIMLNATWRVKRLARNGSTGNRFNHELCAARISMNHAKCEAYMYVGL